MNRFCAFLVFAAIVAPAQVVPGRYIVELRDEPVLTVQSGKQARAASTGRLATVQSAQLRAARQVAAEGFQVVSSMQWVLNALVVQGDDAAAARLAARPEVQAVHPVVLHYPLLDRAVFLQKVTDGWNTE